MKKEIRLEKRLIYAVIIFWKIHRINCEIKPIPSVFSFLDQLDVRNNI